MLPYIAGSRRCNQRESDGEINLARIRKREEVFQDASKIIVTSKTVHTRTGNLESLLHLYGQDGIRGNDHLIRPREDRFFPPGMIMEWRGALLIHVHS